MKIGIIGSGKLAKILAAACIQEKLQIECVFSRNHLHAQKFAEKFGTNAIASMDAMPKDLTIYCVCVNDDAIENVSNLLQVNGTVIHFAGSQSINILAKHKQFGVVWPIQSFSEASSESLKNIPCLIEANTEQTLKVILQFATQLSNSIVLANENERKYYHLAATFVNNFSNHLFSQADYLLQKQKLNFKLLLPILHETIQKIENLNPSQTQTGPAIRKDSKTIQAHLDLLKEEPQMQLIYRLLTQSIQNFHEQN